MTLVPASLPPITFPEDASRQRHFWHQIGPGLLALPWLAALWLGGSLARRDADRWSSVDLYLLLAEDAARPLAEPQLRALLDELFPGGWTCFGPQRLEYTTFLQGMTHARLPAAANEGGVLFRLHWTTPAHLVAHRAGHGAIRLLWARDDLPAAQMALLRTSPPTLLPGDPSAVQAGLVAFWHFLAHLPAALNRDEHLAASALLANARGALTDLVVALNGATRPLSPARINPYLGPAQREAFEKTLRQSAALGESWIGQAVALIVLYRWYAPQLAEMYRLDYPTDLERSVLALLSADVTGWPARITTA